MDITQIGLDFEDLFLEDPEPVENEADLEDLLTSDLDSAIIQATDWTTDTILGQIEKGRIQLNPNFQRRDAWTVQRKSKFIESLILGFPIPQLVLAEAKGQRGRYIVIDGKQRLLSLLQFAGSEGMRDKFETYKLTGVDILTQLNGKSYDELISSNSIDLDEFDSRTIRTVVIRHWKHEAVLYHIFLRLNTGSVQLSPQELRNALHPGPFAEFLDVYSSTSPALRKILNINKPDFRMRDAELLLRYYAFRNLLSQYAGSMKTFLDLTTERFNTIWQTNEEEIRLQAQQFEKAVEISYHIFGKDAFRKWKDDNFIGRFNRAVYDVMIFHFWKPDLYERLLDKADEIKQAFANTSRENPEFVDSIESTTKSLSATVTRLSVWTEVLNETLGTNLSVPQLVNNRIRF